jgi:hypothetical protein
MKRASRGAYLLRVCHVAYRRGAKLRRVEGNMRMPVSGVIVSRWTRACSFRGAGDASHWFTAHMLAKLSVRTARNTGLAIPQLENDEGHDQWQTGLRMRALQADRTFSVDGEDRSPWTIRPILSCARRQSRWVMRTSTPTQIRWAPSTCWPDSSRAVPSESTGRAFVPGEHLVS